MFPVFSKEESQEQLARGILGSRLTHLREFTSAFFELGSPQHKEYEAEVREADRKMLRALTALRCSYSASDPLAQKYLAEVTRLLAPDYPGDEKEYFRVNNPRPIARRTYTGILNQQLKRTHIEIARNFTPEIVCPNMTVAAFAFAAHRGVAVCLNCKRMFALDAERIDGSATEKYCSVACGSRYRQKVYRLKSKRKASGR